MTASSLASPPQSRRPEPTRQVAPLPRPASRPPVLGQAEAVAAATVLARDFAAGASERDRTRTLPVAEIERFSASGLWGITVPRAFGGPELPTATLVEVVRIVSAADPSLGQLPQNHFAFLHLLRAEPDKSKQRELFARVLEGWRCGNALAETGTRTVQDWRTRIRPDDDGPHDGRPGVGRPHGERPGGGADGGFVLDGVKSYCTGALFAHLVPVAVRDDSGRLLRAVVERDAPGLEVIDDWSGFGQRTTASGTVRLDGVRVPRSRVLGLDGWPAGPTTYGPVAQIIQAAVDAGIAEAAIADTVQFVRTRSRPWIDAGQDHAWEDPLTIVRIGELEIRLHAAEAMLHRAAGIIDAALLHEDEDSVAAASIAVAEAKALTTEIALQAANTLFELAGTASTLASHNLDRHWRNARTHTLHDPVRWKYHAVGNWRLNAVRPPVHSWI